MDQNTSTSPAAASRSYRIEAVQRDETRVRKPRQPVTLTLRRLDDNQTVVVKLRHTGQVGDTIQLDERALHVARWKT